MPFRFNQLLEEAEIKPTSVRLLRHQPTVGGKHLVDVWRADPEAFETYQSLQLISKRSSFSRPFWASFIGTWDGRSLFVGLYAVESPEPLGEPVLSPITEALEHPNETERYPTRPVSALGEYAGKLFVDWGGGASGRRAWVQKAESQDKRITELYLDGVERPFPGLMDLREALSELADAPPGWIARLSAAKGVYLLTCPRTGEIYIGSATGEGGFWARWEEYRLTGHGGNVALRERQPSDWQVSILEAAGSGDNSDDILAMEQRWKRKLLSREFGLNRNL